MPGAYYKNETIDVLYITQPVGFIVKDKADALAKKDELAEWLLTGEVVELKFDDEPGRTYFAKLEGTIEDYQKFVDQRSGTLLFLCPDPYAYGPEMQFSAPSDYFNILNDGTAEAEPVFELEVKEPVTFAMIQNQFNEYNMIGKPVDIDSIPYARLATILNDSCSTFVGWTHLPGGTQLDTGIVGGEMEVQGDYGFSAKSYGTNPNGWVGPAIKKSLSEPVQDFRAEIRIGAFNTTGDVGSLELHLLDVDDNVVAILAMRDSTESRHENRAVIQLGQSGNRHIFLNYNGGYTATWNDFSGILRLEREGTEFKAYVAVIDKNGNHIRRYNSDSFNDTLGEYSAEIAQVLVYDAKAKEYVSYDKIMNNIYIGKINQEVGIPYLAQPGDIITFDHTNNGQILINGEPYEDNILGADYFALKKGTNELIVMPDGAFNTSGKYRERYG